MPDCTAGAGGLNLESISDGGGVSQDHPEVLSRLGKLRPLSSKISPSIFWLLLSPLSLFPSLVHSFLTLQELGHQLCLSVVIHISSYFCKACSKDPTDTHAKTFIKMTL